MKLGLVQLLFPSRGHSVGDVGFCSLGDEMTYTQACIRCAHLGSAAVVTAALAAGLAGTPVHAAPLAIENHLVQLQAAAVSAVTNGSVFEDVSPAASVDTAVTVAVMDSTAVAAATDEFAGTLSAVGHTIAAVAGLALAPIWYLAFPITTTLWDVVIAPLFFPDYPKMFGIPGFAMLPMSWFIPYKLYDILFSTVLSPIASPSSAAPRPAATVGAVADDPVATTAATVTAPQRSGRGPRDNGSQRPSARPAAASPAGARSATAAKPAAVEPRRSAKTAAAVQSTTEPTTDGAAPRKGSAARS